MNFTVRDSDVHEVLSVPVDHEHRNPTV